MNWISGLLTLGLWPLAKALFTTSHKQGVLRHYQGYVYLKMFGVPSEEKYVKVLNKFFDADEVLFIAKTGPNQILTESEDAFDEFVDALEAAGFPVTDADGYDLDVPFVFTGDCYRNISSLTLCLDCGRKRVRLYRDNGALRCSSCDSTNVLNPSDMKPKEVLKHVRDFEATAAKSREAAAKRGANLGDLIREQLR